MKNKYPNLNWNISSLSNEVLFMKLNKYKINPSALNIGHYSGLFHGPEKYRGQRKMHVFFVRNQASALVPKVS